MKKEMSWGFLLIVLMGCSAEENVSEPMTQKAKAAQEEIEKEPLEAETNQTTEGQVPPEPSTSMDKWPDLSKLEKEQLVEESIAFVTAKAEADKSPIVADGDTADFVAAVDARYNEIQGLSEEEKWRLSNTTVAAQINIMGDMFLFWYEVEEE